MVIVFSLWIGISFFWIVFLFARSREHSFLRSQWLQSDFKKSRKNIFQQWIQKRRKLKNIQRDLPFFIDLLAVCVMAGMDGLQAIERLVLRLPASDLILELKEMLDDMKLGKTKKESLAALCERIPLTQIKRWVSVFQQSLSLGSPLAPRLLAHAEQMRGQRYAQAEKMGIIASQKILIPLCFCILPSIFLMIFGPLVIRFLQGGLQSFL